MSSTGDSRPLSDEDRVLQPPTKKLKLDYIKCDKCRTDKVKCVPSKRKWPGEKCWRCIEKDEPCSEGRRAGDKTRKRKNGSQTPSTAAIADGNSQPFLNPKVNDWALLVCYHKNMIMALNQLDMLEKETLDLFGREGDDALPNQFIHEFRDFVGCLHHVVLDKTNEIRKWNPSDPRVYPAVMSVLLIQVITEGSLLQLSGGPFEMELGKLARLNDFNLFGDSDIHIVAWMSRLKELCSAILTEPNDDARRNKDILSELDRFETKCEELVASIDTILKELNIHEGLLSYSKRCLLFIPDELSAVRSELVGHVEVNDRQLDCLGRTHLHRCLDAYASDGPSPEPNIGPSTHPKPPIDSSDILGRTPLHIACQKDCLDAVEVLLANGADLGRQTVYGSLPLHYASISGSECICRLLLIQHDCDANKSDRYGKTALHYAIERGNSAIVKLLLSNIAVDPNLNEKASNRPPLLLAIYHDKEEFVARLILAGADPNTVWNTSSKHTPFSYAVLHKRARIMHLLGSRKDVLVDVMDKRNGTALHIATTIGFLEGVKYLLSREDVDVNSFHGGQTPLMKAILGDRLEFVELFLRDPRVDVWNIDFLNRDLLALAALVGKQDIRTMIEAEMLRRTQS